MFANPEAACREIFEKQIGVSINCPRCASCYVGQTTTFKYHLMTLEALFIDQILIQRSEFRSRVLEIKTYFILIYYFNYFNESFE